MKNLECFLGKDIEISLVSGNVVSGTIIPGTYSVDRWGEETVKIHAQNGMDYKIHLNEVKMIEVAKT